jgi:DHA1 family tetracycline resistance protein-like MFS transporter
MAPVLGNLSDRVGRRPVLLLALFALSLHYLLMAVAWTIALLFVGRVIAGAAGATFATANAYVADISTPAQRAVRFGLLGAAWGMGFALGPAIGGFLGEFGTRVPFWTTAALAGVNLLYGFLVLPETLPRVRRRRFEWRRANPLGALATLRRFPLLWGFFLVYVCHQIAHDANPAVWSFFVIEKFSWTESQIGLAMLALGLMIAFSQGVLVGWVIPRIGERRAVLSGLGMMAAGFLGWALAPSGPVLIACIVPWCVGGYAMPALRSLMSQQVPGDSQGELQGAVSSVMGLSAIVAPVLMTQVFRAFTTGPGPYFPGAPFALAAALVVLAMAVFALTVRRLETAPASS